MDIDARLGRLRKLMRERNLSAYIIPTEDFHGSEYVGEYFKAREYMSGFTGSAGTLVVLPDQAALWTDGRYFIQAAQQLAGSSIALMRMGQPGVPALEEYLNDMLTEGSVVGFDGRTLSQRFVHKMAQKTAAKKISFAGGEDLVDMVWIGRPPMSAKPVWEISTDYTGRSREEKLCGVQEQMRAQGADILLLTALDEIAWLLNLRGDDVAYTPVFMAYLVVEQGQTYLYAHREAFSEEILEKLSEAQVTVDAYEAVEQKLQEIPALSRVWCDSGSVNYRLYNSVPAAAERIDKDSPVLHMKAVKTLQEMAHIRDAHVKDGVAVTKFMRWLKTSADREKITELDAARKLETFRRKMEGYLGASFEPIIAYGAHGAVVHYEPTEETDVQIVAGGLCLADTGGHYVDGTTDVTRTLAIGTVTEEEKRYYTLVLRGHLALGAARFVKGVSGQNLDVLAREPLWEEGLDYNHGTGHGVGYLLNVHEGPQRFQWRITETSGNVPLEEGMVLSNEPGIYLEGKFGIRHENLVLCRMGERNGHGQFMYLEPLTMVPFDRDAVLPELLSRRELQWLNAYQEKVYESLSPYFEGEELAWLRRATEELSHA